MEHSAKAVQSVTCKYLCVFSHAGSPTRRVRPLPVFTAPPAGPHEGARASARGLYHYFLSGKRSESSGRTFGLHSRCPIHTVRIHTIKNPGWFKDFALFGGSVYLKSKSMLGPDPLTS